MGGVGAGPRMGEDLRAVHGAAARHSAQRALGGEQRMNDGADRHHAEARLIFMPLRRRNAPAPRRGPFRPDCWARRRPAGVRAATADARGGGEPEDCDPGEDGAERDRRPGRDRKDATRDRKNRVADDPAEAGRQRPASGRRKQRSQRRRRDNADRDRGRLSSRGRSSRRRVRRRQPQNAGGVSSAADARPTNCITMSAAIAPGAPRRLWTRALVA